MSEQDPDQFDEFLSEAVETDAEYQAALEANEQFNRELLTALDSVGAEHVWHPDRDTMRTSRDELARRYEDDGLSIEDSLHTAAVRAIAELDSVYDVSTAKAILDSGNELLADNAVKNAVLNIRSRNLGDKWQEASIAVLRPVTITPEDELEYMANGMIGRIEVDADKMELARAVGRIIFSGIETTGNQDIDAAAASSLVMSIGLYVMNAKKSAHDRANGEEYLHTLFEHSAITQAQLVELKELLNR